MSELIKVGDQIHFLRTLDEAACEEHPGCLYASKGEFGEITKVGECKEGFWVKTKRNPPFGCERKDFELVKLTQELFIKELERYASKNESRTSITQISKVESFAVTTNRYVMAWTDQIDLDLAKINKVDAFPFERAAKLIHSFSGLKFKPFIMPDLHVEACSKCDDGIGRELCKECHGEGELKLESDYNSYTVKCQSCYNEGFVTSDEAACNCFNGWSFDDTLHFESLHLEGANINPCYLKLIEHYPNQQIATSFVEGSNDSKIFHFKSSNKINVIIMGCRA